MVVDGSPWPLVARERELEAVASALVERGVCLIGEAGVGKTRLMNDAIEGARSHGVVPLWVSATRSAAAVPLSVFVDLLPAELPPAGGDRLQLFRAVAAELDAWADGGRAALVVDDAHQLSEAGAALVLHLARSGLSVSVTVRSGAPVPDAITALWKDGLLDRIDVGPLDRAGVDTLLRAALGGPVEQASATMLHDATGGNPLYLRELVLTGRRDEAFAFVDGLWRLTGPLPVGRPMRELIESRVGQLAPAVRRTLDLIAIAGEWPLGALSGDHRRSVEVLEGEALVRIDHDGRRWTVRPAHPIVGESLRQTLGEAAVISTVAELLALQARTKLRRRDDLLRRAVWQLDTGARVDPEGLVPAARRALQLMDPAVAERLARAARDAGDGVAAAVVLATALVEQNRFDAAEHELAEIEDDALQSQDAATYAVQRAYVLGLGLGRVDDAIGFLLSQARSQVPHGQRPVLDAVRALLLSITRRLPEAAALAEEVGRETTAPAVQLTIVTPISTALTFDGKPTQAAERCFSMLPLAEEYADQLPRERVWALGPLVVALTAAGRYDEVDELMHPVYAAATAAHDVFMRGTAANVLGTTALETGRPVRALPWLHEALTPLDRSDPYGFRASALARLAWAEALCGNPRAANDTVARAVDAVRGQLRWHDLPLCHARIWTLVAEGDVTTARTLAIELADEMAYSPLYRAFILHDALRLGATDDRTVRELVDLTGDFEGERCAAINAHAKAILERDPALLCEAVDRLVRSGSLLAAADAAAQAVRIFESAGKHREAATASHRAHEMLEESGAVATPAVAALRPNLLSKREQEVVDLAGRGFSDRDIAARLHVSLRTVQNHLHRAYTKLGISGRQELHVPQRDDADRPGRL